MPIFIAAIGGMLLNLVGSLVGRVLVALGLGVATYTGLSFVLGEAKDIAINSLGSMGPEIVGMLAVMRVGECISMVTSAIGTRLLMQGLQSGTFKRWVHK